MNLVLRSLLACALLVFALAAIAHAQVGEPQGIPQPDSAAVVNPEAATGPKPPIVVPGGDHVGYALAFAGDLDGDGHDDLLIGSYGNDSVAGDAGAVFVIAGKSGDTLFDVFGRHMHDNLGAAVAPAGDLDGDGRPDFAVGAPGVDGEGEEDFEVGCVYFYSGADGQPIDSLLGEGAKTRFGYVVAGLGDLDGDGRPELGVGQRTSGDSDRAGYGGVLVFSGATRKRMYALDGVQAHDHFGSALTGVGDLNGDGRPDILVGAYRFSTTLPSAGAVFIYSGDGTRLGEVDGEALLGHFGFALANLGDLNGDGRSEYAVGARFDDEGGGRSGRVLVMSGTDGRLLRALAGTEGAQFGSSVAAAGDLNGDGKNELCVGAPRVGPDATGAVYVFSGADGKLLVTLAGEARGDQFGTRVTGGGDADGDGVPDLLIGAVGNDDGGVDAGKAYVYSGRDFHLVQSFTGTSRVTAQDTARVARVMEAERALQAAVDTAAVPDTVYDSTQVDVMPILRRSVNAEYPPTAVGSGLSGWVQVRILVLADGAPGRVDIVDDAGLGPDFRLAALKAARQWFFLPATKGGQPVPAWAVFPIGFVQEESRRETAADSTAAPPTAGADSLRMPRPHSPQIASTTEDTLGSARAESSAAPGATQPVEASRDTVSDTLAGGAVSSAGDTTHAVADTGGAEVAIAPVANDSARAGVDTVTTPAGTAGAESGSRAGQLPGVEVDPSRIYDVPDLDREPTLVAKVEPQYPAAALLAGDTCTVVIVATVDTVGAVTRVDVKSCTLPGKGFEESAKAAVRRWRYEPGLRAGIKVTFRIEHAIPFRLQ